VPELQLPDGGVLGTGLPRPVQRRLVGDPGRQASLDPGPAGARRLERHLACRRPAVRARVRHRRGRGVLGADETWWNYSLTAIRHPDTSIGGIFNQGNDITAVVLARREREAELARWREVLQQAPSGAALLRGTDHVFEFANDAYRRLVGGRDVAGKSVADALPEIASQGFVQLLDGVRATGEPYVGQGAKVKLQRTPEGPIEDCIVDFMYQPVRDAAGTVDAILVLVTDVTERARAEAALRLSNWQLGEERARLSSLVEAEKRAQAALRRFNDTLEAHVKQRTEDLTRALQTENAITRRLRATFETDLIFQGYMDAEGTLLDANPVSLAAIDCRREQVVGLPFWDTPWFTATPGLPEQVRAAIARARGGEAVRTELDVILGGQQRRFRFSVRPVFGDRRTVVGLVPEALEISPPAP
jgi:PAS domain S-box-containing protein